MQRDPRVTITVIDKDNPYKYAEVAGQGRRGGPRVATPGPDIDRLSQKYNGTDYDPSAITSRSA